MVCIQIRAASVVSRRISTCHNRVSLSPSIRSRLVPTEMVIHDDGLSPEAMLAFYQRLYPFKSIFHWLNHEPAPTRLFINREFAFTLQGDVYLRYNSFTNADELKKQVCTLNPTRFEIGPMYSARVSCVDPLPPPGFPIISPVFPAPRAAKRQENRATDRLQTSPTRARV